MPGRETMSVSKAKKGQIRSVPGCGATKGSLTGWGREGTDLALWDSNLVLRDSDKPRSAGLVPKMLHLAPHRLQGQVFCLVLRSSRPPFDAFTACTWSHQRLALSDRPCNGQGEIPQMSHCAGSELLPGSLGSHLPGLRIGPDCPANPAAGMGEFKASLLKSLSSSLFLDILPKDPAT